LKKCEKNFEGVIPRCLTNWKNHLWKSVKWFLASSCSCWFFML